MDLLLRSGSQVEQGEGTGRGVERERAELREQAGIPIVFLAVCDGLRKVGAGVGKGPSGWLCFLLET